MGLLLAAVIVGIMILAIIGLGWQTFFFGIAKGAQQVVDNPIVDEAKEYWGELSGTAKRSDH
jgi:hypothetical protein